MPMVLNRRRDDDQWLVRLSLALDDVGLVALVVRLRWSYFDTSLFA